MIASAAPYLLHRRSKLRTKSTQVSPWQSDGRNEDETKEKGSNGENFRRHAKDKQRVDATMYSFEGVTKATQAIATEIADYTKRSFENGTKTMENLLGAKSLDKAFEVQSEYAKSAYEDYVSCATKLGALYTDLAKEAFKPYQGFVARATPLK
jgi:hypothetical protein